MLIIYSSGKNHESDQYTPILYIHEVPRASMRGHSKHGKDVSENSSTKHVSMGTQVGRTRRMMADRKN